MDVFQTAVFGHGVTESSFTINGLGGDPGPTTERTYTGGTATTLGTLLASHTFVVGDVDDSFGPVVVGAGPFTSDASSYGIAFTHADQSFGGSTELTTNGPEASTWAMMLIGFIGLAFGAATRKRLREVY